MYVYDSAIDVYFMICSNAEPLLLVTVNCKFVYSVRRAYWSAYSRRAHNAIHGQILKYDQQA